MTNLTLKKATILIIFFIVIILAFSLYINKKKNTVKEITKIQEPKNVNTNIIDEIRYSSKDLKGNEYVIFAEEGEIDYKNSDIIFLKKVKAVIKLIKNNEVINITADFGKYNTINYDTIFSKNVVIDYIDNNIKGNYLDFSMVNNLLIVSKNVIYTNSENILFADVIKMNTTTKDINIIMHNSEDKVLVQSLN